MNTFYLVLIILSCYHKTLQRYEKLAMYWAGIILFFRIFAKKMRIDRQDSPYPSSELLSENYFEKGIHQQLGVKPP